MENYKSPAVKNIVIHLNNEKERLNKAINSNYFCDNNQMKQAVGIINVALFAIKVKNNLNNIINIFIRKG